MDLKRCPTLKLQVIKGLENFAALPLGSVARTMYYYRTDGPATANSAVPVLCNRVEDRVE